MHQDLAALGCLLTLVLAPSCGQDETPVSPRYKSFEEIQAEPRDGIPAGLAGIDRHRNRTVGEWVADIESGDRFKCFRAIVAVGELEDKGEAAIPAITKVLQDTATDGGVKRKAIAALGRIGGAQAVRSLDACMLGGDDVLGVLAADALGSMGSSAVDSILPYLKSSNPIVRERGVRALRSVLSTDGTVTKMEAAVVPLAHALGDDSPGVRDIALRVLSELGQRALAAAPVLVEELRVEKDLEQRKLLMVMLGMFGESARDAIPILRESLLEDDQQIRLFSALALAKVGEVEEGLAPLIAYLADPDPMVRLTAADALRRIGPPATAAVEPLKQARKGANDSLHLMIEQALKAIRGHA